MLIAMVLENKLGIRDSARLAYEEERPYLAQSDAQDCAASGCRLELR